MNMCCSLVGLESDGLLQPERRSVKVSSMYWEGRVIRPKGAPSYLHFINIRFPTIL